MAGGVPGRVSAGSLPGILHTHPHPHSHQVDPLFPASDTPDSSPAGVSPTLPFADCLLDLCQLTVTELDDAPAVSALFLGDCSAQNKKNGTPGLVF